MCKLNYRKYFIIIFNKLLSYCLITTTANISSVIVLSIVLLSLQCGQWNPEDDVASLKLSRSPNKHWCEVSLTSRKLFSKATLMLVSMLVLFLRRRFRPSMPSPGEPRELGLDRAWSDDWFSAQTARTKAQRETDISTCGKQQCRRVLEHQLYYFATVFM